MKDIRLDVGLLDHHKTVRLERTLGHESFKNLLRLWMYVSRNKPSGVLNGMTIAEIEMAAKWRGEPGKFVEALLLIGWLDNNDGSLKIHDWEYHQPWVVGAEHRSRMAKINALKRWRPRK